MKGCKAHPSPEPSCPQCITLNREAPKAQTVPVPVPVPVPEPEPEPIHEDEPKTE